jgi:hypothetical protein
VLRPAADCVLGGTGTHLGTHQKAQGPRSTVHGPSYRVRKQRASAASVFCSRSISPTGGQPSHVRQPSLLCKPPIRLLCLTLPRIFLRPAPTRTQPHPIPIPRPTAVLFRFVVRRWSSLPQPFCPTLVTVFVSQAPNILVPCLASPTASHSWLRHGSLSRCIRTRPSDPLPPAVPMEI